MMKILRTIIFLSTSASSLFAQSPAPVTRKSITTPEKTLAIVVHLYKQNASQQVLVKDPKGRLIGKNALTGKTYHTADNASYDIEGQGDLDNVSTVVAKSVTFEDPVTGNYDVLLSSKTAGGFAIFVNADCESTVARKQLIRQSFAAAGTREFVVHFDPTSCKDISIQPK